MPVIVRLRDPAGNRRWLRREGGLADVLRARRAQLAEVQGEVIRSLDNGGRRIHSFKYHPFLAMVADADTLKGLRNLPQVEGVYEDLAHEPSLDVSVPLIGATPAQTGGFDGSGEAVAVLDTGVELTHAMFSNVNVPTEACFSGVSVGGTAGVTSFCNAGLPRCTDSEGLPIDYSECGPGAGDPCTGHGSCYHGTHVASIAVGNGGAYFGVARGADLVPIQVFVLRYGALVAYTSDLIAALEHVLESSDTYDIAAVNMSLGGGTYYSNTACDASDPLTKEAIDNLRDVGIATVIAAGNDYKIDSMSNPGCISSAVSVAASTDTDTIASFSNRATYTSVFAPGNGIVAAVTGGGYGSASGTSMASPHVAGTMAILKEKAWADLAINQPGEACDGFDVCLDDLVSLMISSLRMSGVPIVDASTGFEIPRVQVDAALGLVGNPPVREYILDSDLVLQGVANGNCGAGAPEVCVASGDFDLLSTLSAYGCKGGVSGCRSVTDSFGGDAYLGVDTQDLNIMRFEPHDLLPGTYSVQVWWQAFEDNTNAAEVTVYHDGAPEGELQLVDQRIDGTRWNCFGIYSFGTSVTPAVELSDGGNGNLIVDAVRWVPVFTAGPPVLETDTLPPAIEQLAYSATLEASGGVGAYEWTIASGALPAGLGVDAGSGVISGVPTEDGLFAFEVQVTDQAGAFDRRSLSLEVLPAGTVQNLALPENGGVVSASSTVSGSYPVAAVNNGDRKGIGWGSGGGWNDGTQGVYPDWVQIDLAVMSTLSRIDVFTLQDAYASPVEPTPSLTFQNYGITDFAIQYWTGAAWATVPGGSVTANNLVWRSFAFPEVTTDRVRVLIDDSLASYSRVVEIEVWGSPGGGGSNDAPSVVLTAPGDGVTFQAPATLLVAADASDSDGAIERVELFAGDTPIATLTSAPYEFEWADVPTGDHVLTARAYDDLGASTVSAPVTISVQAQVGVQTNLALPANGGVASASSTFNTKYPVAAVNNGDRRGVNWGNGGGWNDATNNAYPDWVEISLAAGSSIGEIDVFTLQDNFGSPQEPTPDMTFTNYGIEDFQVQYWAGSSWQTVPGGNVTGNDKVWRSFVFPEVTTDKIRVSIEAGLQGYSRIVEIEAWETGEGGGGGNLPPVVNLTAPTETLFVSPADVLIAADAADADGSIARVVFYADATPLFTDTAAPYEYQWNDVPVGDHVITAKAYDDAGQITESAPLQIHVEEAGDSRINLALASEGAVVTASSTFDGRFPTSAVNNGDRLGIGWASGGGWNDATKDAYPDWVQVLFPSVSIVGQIDVFTLQDNPQSPQEPTPSMTFTKFGITDFEVQYWTGADWATVSGGSVTGNDLVWRSFVFPEVTTDRIRVRIDDSLADYSRVVEIEAYGAPAP